MSFSPQIAVPGFVTGTTFNYMRGISGQTSIHKDDQGYSKSCEHLVCGGNTPWMGWMPVYCIALFTHIYTPSQT